MKLNEKADATMPVIYAKAKNKLLLIDCSPLREELDKALAAAEDAMKSASGTEESSGAIWWMNRELEKKQKIYCKKN